MPATDFLPVLRSNQNTDNKVVEDRANIEALPSTGLVPAMRSRINALGFGTFRGLSRGERRKYEPAPYDFMRIIKAAETDSFVRQGLNKYRELLWKNGWDIVSDNPEAVEYLYERLAVMELAMRQPFSELLTEAGDQLVKFGNLFLAKARADVNEYYPRNLQQMAGRGQVAGYYVLPAETMEVARTNHNVPIAYRQNPEHRELAWSSRQLPTWEPRDIIHVTVDRPPGRIFGVPFLTTVLDDVVALRQMEEDVSNLVHKELFPLYKYIVGDETNPAEQHEVQEAAKELEHLESEGGIAMPHTRDLQVVGDSDSALDASSYLHAFIVRVAAGLGLAPHHLGVMEDSGNRSVTDRLDQALYDRVKSYQNKLSEAIRFEIFNELLLEAGFRPYGHISGQPSDSCVFRFKEIDIDAQIKLEEHELQKFNSQLQDLWETRQNIGLDDSVDENWLQAAVQARVDAKYQTGTGGGGSGEPSEPNKPNTQQPSKGGSKNQRNPKRGTGNKARPANQHGSRLSPNVRRTADDTMLEVADLLAESEEDDDNVQ